jgi:hypothetical protein
MKKVFMLATAALMVTGMAFAQDGGKKCGKGKSCCKKEAKATRKDSKIKKA